MKTIKTVLHAYRFDLTDDVQAAQYAELCERLTAAGLCLMDGISDYTGAHERSKIAPLDGQTVELETKHLFENQWNTAPTTTSEQGLRVFDWHESIVPNRDIKIGHWLEQTEEMREIRRSTVKCGYCGAQHPAADGLDFCSKCLGSKYLKQSELHLLRLLPISSRAERKPLTDAEHDILLPKYIDAQTKARDEKNAADTLRHLDKKVRLAEEERDGTAWLLNNGVCVDNCIYYAHTRTFCFGWKTPCSEEVASRLLDILVGFPYSYEIEKEDGKKLEAMC